jgi:hypothetical protein
MVMPGISKSDVDKARTSWNNNFGTCPNDYRIRENEEWVVNFDVGLPYAKLKANSPLKGQYKALANLSVAGGKAVAKGFAGIDELAKQNPNDPHAKSAAATSATGPSPASPTVPGLPAVSRAKAIELLKKYDLKSHAMMPTAEMKKIEDRSKSFFEELNLSREQFWNMSYDFLLDIAKNVPEAAADMIFTLRMYQQKTWKMIEDISAKNKPAETAPKEAAAPATGKPLTLAERRAAQAKKSA